MPVSRTPSKGVVPGNSAARGTRPASQEARIDGIRCQGRSPRKRRLSRRFRLGEGDEVVFARAVSDHKESDARVVAQPLGGLDYDFETLEQPVQSEVADQEVLGSDAE